MGSGDETSFDSKQVMMRAEHRDEINVETLGVCEVIQRTETYYGPKLRIEVSESGEQYILHAPGPNSELQLSAPGREPLRTVSADLVGTKQYDICPACGEPLKTIEHRRQSHIGACATASGGD